MATGHLNVIALISGGKDSFYSLLHCLRHGHRIVALANLHPPAPPAESQQDEADLNSFMYQTVGHEVVPLYAEATGIPLYRQPIAGAAAHHERDYAPDDDDDDDASPPPGVVVDETESMTTLLRAVMQEHPEADALCSGAILSTYQRTRVESVAARLRLAPLAYLWQYTALPAPAPAEAEADEVRLLLDMAAAGLEARIVKVASAGLGEGHLWERVSGAAGAGRVRQALRRFGAAEGAALGEGGEFETLVVDGPGCLFRKRIVVPEQGRRVVREGGGSAWLLTRGAHVQDKDALEAESPVDVRVPELFDAKFAQVLDDLVARPDELVEPVTAGYEARPLSKTKILLNDHPELLSWNLISDETYEPNLIAEETKSIVCKLKEALARNGLSAAQLTTVVIVLRNMADFPKINQEYGTIFDSPNPASRVTISCGPLLPEGRNVMLYATAPPASPTLTRNGLHVQSRSYWAPANIGPYSQAIEVPITRNLVALGPRSVHVAGQIPLVPHSMTLPAPSGSALAEQITLSLQHLWRVGAQMKVQQWTSAVAYFDRAAAAAASAEDMRRRARLAGRAWHAMHAAAAPDDDDDDEEAALDPWDLKYNAQFASLAVSSSGQSAAPQPPLPDWEVFPLRQRNEPGTCVPPFFAVEVEGLPRGAAVEWHAHAGLSGLAGAGTQMVAHDESRLGGGWRAWSTAVRAEGGVFVHTVLADAGESGSRRRKPATVGGVAAAARAKYREAVRLLGAADGAAAAEAPYLMYVDKDGMAAGWGEAAGEVQLPCAVVPGHSIWTADGKRASCVALFRLSVGAC